MTKLSLSLERVADTRGGVRGSGKVEFDFLPVGLGFVAGQAQVLSTHGDAPILIDGVAKHRTQVAAVNDIRVRAGTSLKFRGASDRDGLPIAQVTFHHAHSRATAERERP